jgi:hypothetical protein
MRIRLLALAGACVALGAACTHEMGRESSTGTSAAPVTDLRIEIQPGFSATPEVRRYRLRCDPPGGDVPDAAAACRRLAEEPELLEPAPACSDQVLDAPVAKLRGVYRDSAVRLDLGGCSERAARWAELSKALGVSSGP